jgi:hypothetical protein
LRNICTQKKEVYDRPYGGYAGHFTKSFDPEYQYRCWSFDYTDVTGQARQWVDDWRMVISWSGVPALPFLPLAQIGFDDMFDDDE